jgi:hypothetical protein
LLSLPGVYKFSLMMLYGKVFYFKNAATNRTLLEILIIGLIMYDESCEITGMGKEYERKKGKR